MLSEIQILDRQRHENEELVAASILAVESTSRLVRLECHRFPCGVGCLLNWNTSVRVCFRDPHLGKFMKMLPWLPPRLMC